MTRQAIIEQTLKVIDQLPKERTKKPSLIRLSKIVTIDKSLTIGQLGNLENSEIMRLNKNLKLLLQLP